MLTTRGRYAVMAMAEIALRAKSSPVRLSDIAQSQQIDIGYLEQLFMKLKKANLVKAARGPGGGYLLARDINSINIFEIMHAVNESTKMTRCSHNRKANTGGCLLGGAKCITHNLWDEMTKNLEDFLLKVTLKDLCQKKVGGTNEGIF